MEKETAERAEKALTRMLEWIGRHDSRSAGVLGIALAMVGALSSSVPPAAEWTLALAAVIGVAAVGFLLVFGELLRGQFPRMRDTPSLFFFGTVANLPLTEFRDQFRQLDQDAYLQDVLTQCHVNARILRSKFRSLKRSMVALLITAVPWTVALGMIKVMR